MHASPIRSAGPRGLEPRNRSHGLIESTAAVALRAVRAPFDACEFEVGEGLESRRHHMEHRAIVGAEDLIGNFEGALGLALDEIEHLGLAITMMLDELVGAMAMVAIDAAVRGQHQLNVEILHL